MMSLRNGALAALAFAAAGLGACTTAYAPSGDVDAGSSVAASSATRVRGAVERAAFEADRRAILAMAGEYAVTFDFTETVSFVDGYELKEPYVTGGNEVVRVIADEGDFISLQHILVVGDGDGFPIKHWRQDWIYEPASVHDFVGGNAWARRELSEEERRGKWAQVVYQVDDAPRYSAVAEWTHENGVSAWTSPLSLRPLPRRDATKRDDYHGVYAVNRHAITPDGWVHEQDNSKLVMAGPLAADGPQILVREVAVNTYTESDAYRAATADEYWAATSDYWAAIRSEWTRMERENDAFGLTIQGEPEALYNPILSLASEIQEGTKTTDEAVVEARAIIAEYTTTEIGDLESRLGGAPSGAAY